MCQLEIALDCPKSVVCSSFKFFANMIKARAHKGGVRIGKTPKKLASICCP
jgi:hypothetical protein